MKTLKFLDKNILFENESYYFMFSEFKRWEQHQLKNIYLATEDVLPIEKLTFIAKFFNLQHRLKFPNKYQVYIPVEKNSNLIDIFSVYPNQIIKHDNISYNYISLSYNLNLGSIYIFEQDFEPVIIL